MRSETTAQLIKAVESYLEAKGYVENMQNVHVSHHHDILAQYHHFEEKLKCALGAAKENHK